MCRFLVYKGAPILMDKLLYQPRNSLIHQSFQARERTEPLNGDGFGVGWYIPEIDPTPAVFVSVRPAWNNRNLQYMAPKIQSNCIFAHVRAATRGGVSETNCHPFHYGKFLFMHNGSIGGFKVIKRALRSRLSDGLYDWLQGETDSEHFFALFMEKLQKKGEEYSSQNIAEALEEAIWEIKELVEEHGIKKPSFLNVAVTDGKHVIASRYVSDSDFEPHTLYHSEGSCFECVDGVCRMRKTDPSEHAILIVSEKLTDVEEDWHEVPSNHMVIVGEDLTVSLKPIEV